MSQPLLTAWQVALVGLTGVAAWAGFRHLWRGGRLRRDWHNDLALASLLAVAAGIFFYRLFLGLGWMPVGGGDLVSFLYPTYSFAQASLRTGTIPLWNPTLFTGAPFAADNQSGLFYPVNWLFFLLTPAIRFETMELMSVFHTWLAGVCMATAVILVLDSGDDAPRAGFSRRWPAALAGLAYMFSDLFVTHFGNLNLIAVAAWMPLVFGLFYRSIHLRRANWSVAAGAVFALATLAGHAQMTLYLVFLLGLYALFRVVVPETNDPQIPPRSAKAQAPPLESHSPSRVDLADRLRPAWSFAAMLVVGIGLSAVAALPAVEMTAFTTRAGLSYAEATRYSLPVAGLTGLFTPILFGRGPAGFWGPWDRVELGYAGVFTLVLAGVAVAAVWRRGRTAARQRTAFFTGLVVLAMLLAMGSNTPLYGLIYRLVPGFGQVRVPARLIILADFGLAMLAAEGAVTLLSTARPASSRSVSTIVLVLAGIALVGLPVGYLSVRPGPEHLGGAEQAGFFFAILLLASGMLCWLAAGGGFPANLFGLLAAAVLLADLTALGAGSDIEMRDPSAGFRHPAVVAFLQSDPSPFRIDNAAGAWQPDAAAIYGLYDMNGVSNPLELAATNAYRWSVGWRGSPPYNFLGVKYVLAGKGQPPGDASFVRVFDGDPDIDVYLNIHALPRALLVYRTRQAASSEDAFRLIHTPDFDPAHEVVVEGGPELSGNPGAGDRSVRFTGYGSNEVDLLAQTPSPAYLVLSDAWYPGWQATIDGQPVPILRANFAYRAVRIPSGEHQVRFEFRPVSMWIGTILSLLSLAGVAAIAVRQRKWARLNKTYRPLPSSLD